MRTVENTLLRIIIGDADEKTAILVASKKIFVEICKDQDSWKAKDMIPFSEDMLNRRIQGSAVMAVLSETQNIDEFIACGRRMVETASVEADCGTIKLSEKVLRVLKKYFQERKV